MHPESNRIDVVEIQEKHPVVKYAIERTNDTLEESNIRRLFKEVTFLKSFISNLQNELSAQASQSSSLKMRMDGVLSSISHLESGSGPLATVHDLQSLKSTLTEQIYGLQRHIIDAETVMQNALSNNLKELKELHTNLDAIMRSECSQMTSKLSSLATSSDLKAIEEYLEGGIRDHDAKIETLQHGILCTEGSVTEMKYYIFLSTVLRIHSSAQNRLQKRTIFIWCEYMKSIESEIAISNARKKIMRKLIHTCWFRKKKFAFEKWRELFHWQRRCEIKQKEIMMQILRRMENKHHDTLRFGFNKWRRAVIAERVDLNGMVSNSIEQSHIGSNGNAPHGSYSKRFDLSLLFDTFKNDRDGVIQMLANEVMNMKSVDFEMLRQEMHNIRERILVHCENSLMSRVNTLTESFHKLEERLIAKIELSTSNIPGLKTSIVDIRNALSNSVSRIHSVEETHHDRLEVLFEAKEIAESDSFKLKNDLASAKSKIAHLESNQSEMQNLLKELSSKLSTLEGFCDEQYRRVDNEFIDMKDNIRNISSRFHTSESNQSSIFHDLINLRNDIIQSKIHSNERFDEIDKTFTSYGVTEPKYDEIIKYGILYEGISKEKNYLIPMNCIFDDSKIDMDVPSCIASFSHDYATWVAYKSDHDSLKLTIVGKSADEAVDTEDESEERRRTLVNCFRKTLLHELETANPDAGAARLEARSFFVSRVMDAIETALSKHNQVYIPNSTRLGRVRSSMSTCVACDRPLSRKNTRRRENEKTNDKDIKPSSRPKTVLATDDTQKYILRGGFKFPAKGNM
jgi:predicted  nucleic acid-binding Zn-ribbon protein